MNLNPGDLIGGQYKIIKELGAGCSQTYLAEDKNNSYRQVVVKEIIPLSSNIAILLEAKRRFNIEAQVLKRLGTHSQIPELFNSFEKSGKFYLIQEFIEGDTLNKELKIGNRLQEDEVINLLQEILEILKFVHQEQVIHRDIKPANIIRDLRDRKLVLIDFGAVKEISTLEESAGSMNPTISIGTPGYMPPEQGNRQARFSSDIYAVGMIGIQALTGLDPSSQIKTDPDGEIIWRHWAQVCPELANILDKMVRYHFNDRYQSASEALQALQALQESESLTSVNFPLPPPPPPWWKLVFSRLINFMSQVHSLSRQKILWLGLAVATLAGAIIFSQLLTPQPKIAPGENHLSEGKKILIPGSILSEKQKGVKAFADGKYSEAISLFEQARKKEPRDPETLIYLNNARIAAQNLPAYTIAVAAPIDSGKENVKQSGQELLRGVAQAQDEVNGGQKINGKSLKVAIADDAEKEDQGTAIANVLTAKSDILAVVGHFSSSVTLKTAPIYEKEKLVLISPTSTSEDISQSGDFIFRTVSSDRVAAQSLSSYLLNRVRQQTVAVFYNPGNPYSQSLRDRFQTTFRSGGGNIVEEFDLSTILFNPDIAVDKAKKLGSTGLILFPNISTRDPAIKAIKANRDGYCMVGGDSLYNFQTLKDAGKESVYRLVIATFWHRLNSPNQQFPKDSEILWQAPVSPNTASAYDATSAVIEALKTVPQPTRINIQEALANASFKTIGATGKISFDKNGDRKEPTIQLVAVVPSSNNSAYEFVPIDDPRVRFNCP